MLILAEAHRLWNLDASRVYGTVGRGRYCRAQAQSMKIGFLSPVFAPDNLIISAEQDNPTNRDHFNMGRVRT